MVNPNNEINQDNQENVEHSSFFDQADEKFNQAIEKGQKLAPGVTSDDDETAGSKDYSKNLMGKAEQEVRENEDASLQDDTYSFDEDNTDNEEYHDVDDAGGSIDLDNDEDFIQ